MNEQTSFHSVAPDAEAIARHLEVLFGYLGGYVPIRLLSEAGTPTQSAQCQFE